MAARSRELLEAHNVRHVVNCGRTADHFRGEENGPEYLSLGLRDDIAINGDELFAQLERATAFINKALAEEGESTVLVHCREGISRSCGVMIAHLMVTEKYELHAAMEHLRSLHQQCDPNLGILMALTDWPEWFAQRQAEGCPDDGTGPMPMPCD